MGGIWWKWEEVWPGVDVRAIHINVLELVAQVTMVWFWRAVLRGYLVICNTDSTVALGVQQKGHSAASVRLQAAVERWGEVTASLGEDSVVDARWISTRVNLFADALSRDPQGTSSSDREARQWRDLLESSGVPLVNIGLLPELRSWWRSWTARLQC